MRPALLTLSPAVLPGLELCMTKATLSTNYYMHQPVASPHWSEVDVAPPIPSVGPTIQKIPILHCNHMAQLTVITLPFINHIE